MRRPRRAMPAMPKPASTTTQAAGRGTVREMNRCRPIGSIAPTALMWRPEPRAPIAPVSADTGNAIPSAINATARNPLMPIPLALRPGQAGTALPPRPPPIRDRASATALAGTNRLRRKNDGRSGRRPVDRRQRSRRHDGAGSLSAPSTSCIERSHGVRRQQKAPDGFAMARIAGDSSSHASTAPGDPCARIQASGSRMSPRHSVSTPSRCIG